MTLTTARGTREGYVDAVPAHHFTSTGASALGYACARNTTNNVPLIDTDTATAGDQKNITTYHRRHVTLDAKQVAELNTSGTTLNVRRRADDGAMACINGHEINRKDASANQTFTTSAAPDAAFEQHARAGS